MANEIQINATMAATKNNSSIGGGDLFNYTMAGNLTNKVVQAVSSWAALSLGGTITGTVTAIYVKNLDTVNAITLGLDSTHPFAIVPPGGTIPIIVPSGVSYVAQASSGTVNIEIGIAQ